MHTHTHTLTLKFVYTNIVKKAAEPAVEFCVYSAKMPFTMSLCLWIYGIFALAVLLCLLSPCCCYAQHPL